MIKHKGLFLFPAVLLAFVACGSSNKTGNISGRLVFGSYDEEKPQQDVRRLGIPDVMIVLCQVDKGLPKGPVVADMNENNSERIGVIRTNPNAITDSNGNFMLKEVPVGTYLVLFHLLPDVLKIKGDNWGDGMIVTEADIDASFKRIPSTSQEFWIMGGFVTGKGDWNSQDGFILNKGTVGSAYSGFFFSVHNQRPYPIVKVQSDATVEILLTTYVLPGNIEQ